MVDRRHRARKKSTLDMGAKAPARSGSLRLFVLLAIMVLVNLYVFVWRDGTSIGDIRKKAKRIVQARRRFGRDHEQRWRGR